MQLDMKMTKLLYLKLFVTDVYYAPGFVRMTPLIISTKIKAECMQVALEMEGWYMDA